jgi:uncharacterized protein
MPPWRNIAALGALGGVWALWEATWLELRRLDIPVVGLHPDLDGLRIAHLADLHVGAPGFNAHTLRRAVDMTRDEAPDLICLSGDLRSRLRGDRPLRRQLRRLDAPHGSYAVLGNHDYAHARDPFADGRPLADLDDTPVRLLVDERADVVVGRARLAIAGVDPRRAGRDRPPYDASRLARQPADAKVLLAHYPDTFDDLRPGQFDLVLSGHLHGGQICLPYPGGKVYLHTPRSRYREGLYGRDGTLMHLSRGVGTTVVPFRFAARPELAVLTLRGA